MNTITILVGPPASGKSTWASTQDAVVVSRDTIRAEIIPGWNKGTPPVHDTEVLVTKEQNKRILAALRDGHDVIVDNMNIEARWRKDLANLAKRAGVGPVNYIERVFHTPLDVCLARNANREHPVPEAVIKNAFKRLGGYSGTNYVIDAPRRPDPLPDLPRAIIVDIDGTVADPNGRDPYDASECIHDLPIKPILGIVAWYPGHVFFVSGRSADYREQTVKWLNKHTDRPYELLMRKSGDVRPDAVIKRELYVENIQDKNAIEFVIDDRPRVVRMWRDLGLLVLQVNDVDF